MKIRRPSSSFLFTCITAAVTVALTVFRTVALFTNFDPKAQHYLDPAVEALSTYGFLLPLLLFIPLALTLPKRTTLTQIGEGKRFFFLPLALFLTASAIELFVTATVERLTTLSFVFAILAAVAAGISALPYLFKILKLSLSEGAMQLLFAFFSVYMILYAMFAYFDERHYMNNPNAMLLILAAVVLSLFLFYDARALSSGGARLSLYFMANSVVLSVSFALPSLLYRMFGGGGLAASLVFELLLLSAALPLAARLAFLSQTTFGGTDK